MVHDARQKILVIDDDSNIRFIVRFKLESDGYQVILANDGKEGVDAALEQQPDLIIVDIQMPVMDGFTALQALKAEPRTAHIPVVMLTARGQRLDELRGRELGAREFLNKPFSPRKLSEVISQLLASPESSTNTMNLFISGEVR